MQIQKSNNIVVFAFAGRLVGSKLAIDFFVECFFKWLKLWILIRSFLQPYKSLFNDAFREHPQYKKVFFGKKINKIY